MKRKTPVTAIVLAAGRSSRMGRAKQLEVVNGVPMVVQAVRTALASGAGQVMVITGAYADQVTALIAQQPALSEDARLTLIHNPLWASGQASSVHAAISALPASVQAALFLPVDQPYLPTEFLQALITAWQQGARLAAPIVEGEYRGAPAIFDRSLWAALLAIQGDVGGRPVLLAHRSEVNWLPIAGEALRDIDTPEDLNNA